MSNLAAIIFVLVRELRQWIIIDYTSCRSETTLFSGVEDCKFKNLFFASTFLGRAAFVVKFIRNSACTSQKSALLFHRWWSPSSITKINRILFFGCHYFCQTSVIRNWETYWYCTVSTVHAFLHQGKPAYSPHTRTPLYSLTICAIGIQWKSVIATMQSERIKIENNDIVTRWPMNCIKQYCLYTVLPGYKDIRLYVRNSSHQGTVRRPRSS